MFEIYNTFVSSIRDMSTAVFAIIMAVMFLAILIFLIGFIKANDSKSKKIVSKLGNIIMIIIILAICAYLVAIR